MFKSLRWRLQVWHAVVLLIVLTSFGVVVYGQHWRNRLQQIDAELNRTTDAVMKQFRRSLPRRPRPQERSARENLVAEHPAPEHSPAEQPTSEQPTSEQPTSEQPTSEQPTSEQPTSEQPTSEQPTSEQPTSEQPTSEQPTSEQPTSEQPTSEQLAKDPPRREQTQREQPARERGIRDLGPPPAEFEQLFHGDEESRYYYIFWDSDGKVWQKSDLAPSIDCPGLHAGRGPNGLPFRLARERRADHIYEEVITCFQWPPPPPSRIADQSPKRTSDWNVLVGRSIEKDITAQHHSGLRLVAIGLVILTAGMLGGGWLSSRAIRPITAMTATAEAISAQNLTERIDVSDTDSELGNLATVLNASFDPLQTAVERQRQFTADASHELRTPLSVIAAHTELALSRQRSNEEYQATIETCWRASQRMKSLIDSLLLLARFDSGAPPLKNARMNLESLVRDGVELVEPLASARGIQIECQTASCPVWGDSDRLSQVVTNLLTNAIRYNVDGGSIRVTTRMESATAVMSVADSGVGIAADQLPRIFDRFYQVDKARSRAEGSCGLGLSICKTIVEAHGGSITATSQVDVGTTLQVRLPVKAEYVASGERESNERQMVSSLANA